MSDQPRDAAQSYARKSGKMDDHTQQVAGAIDTLLGALGELHKLCGDGFEFGEMQIRFEDDTNRLRVAQTFAGHPLVDWQVRPWLAKKRPTLVIGEWWDDEPEDSPAPPGMEPF